MRWAGSRNGMAGNLVRIAEHEFSTNGCRPALVKARKSCTAPFCVSSDVLTMISRSKAICDLVRSRVHEDSTERMPPFLEETGYTCAGPESYAHEIPRRPVPLYNADRVIATAEHPKAIVPGIDCIPRQSVRTSCDAARNLRCKIRLSETCEHRSRFRFEIGLSVYPTS